MNAQNVLKESPEEEIIRADMYQFLAGILQREPSDKLVNSYKSLSGDKTPIGEAFGVLSKLADKIPTEDIRSEYMDLFIGMGRGELLPFGSFYITGFLHDKPLAKLRRDLNSIGIKREESFKEPEDHIACLCEIMSGMISGTYGKNFTLAEQRNFFKVHVQPWAEHFFTDLEGAKTALFYSPVGTIGKLFMQIESEAFEMDATR